MPRARTILQSEFPYHLTARCINKEWFQIPMPEVWTIFCEELARANKARDLLIHSFVLMSNHFHLIASTPKENISECMRDFMHTASRRLTRRGNRINETFAGRHYKCILHSPRYFLNAYKYNYRNPVASGLCKAVEDYPYSTLRGLLYPSEARIPLAEDLTWLSDPVGTLKWLNTPPHPDKLEGVRYGLKRPYFKSKNHRQTNKPLISADDVL